MDPRTLILGVLLLVPLAAVMVLLVAHSRALSMGQSMLDHWTQQNGLQVRSRERCWFFKGSFFWNSSDGQRVYRVVVQDRDGRIRSGYVRCGGFWLGLLSDRVDVRWDD